MIASQTPFRISFLGGGTDFPQWFNENEGGVLSTTIDKYCYITLRNLPPFFYHKHRVVYTEIELVKETGEIRHPSVRECLKFLNIADGLEIHHDGDLPSRSGLGSSSSFTVGLLHALKAYQGQVISKPQLCDLALTIEKTIIGEAGGIQDQIAVSHGGLNHVKFNKSGWSLNPLVLSPKVRREFEQSLCLFFTGKSRIAEELEKKKLLGFRDRKKELLALMCLLHEGIRLLQKPDFPAKEFGELLHESWVLKKSFAKEVTNPDIDDLYDRGLDYGAHGGKILGAGGGGFLLFCVDSYRRDEFIEKMKPLLHVPFKFESAGSRICLYQP